MVAMAPLAIDRPSGPVHVRGRPLGNFTRLAPEGSGFAGKTHFYLVSTCKKGKSGAWTGRKRKRSRSHTSPRDFLASITRYFSFLLSFFFFLSLSLSLSIYLSISSLFRLLLSAVRILEIRTGFLRNITSLQPSLLVYASCKPAAEGRRPPRGWEWRARGDEGGGRDCRSRIAKFSVTKHGRRIITLRQGSIDAGIHPRPARRSRCKKTGVEFEMVFRVHVHAHCTLLSRDYYSWLGRWRSDHTFRCAKLLVDEEFTFSNGFV